MALKPTTSSDKVKERVELYFYALSGPSWPVLGRILPLSLFIYIYIYIYIYIRYGAASVKGEMQSDVKIAQYMTPLHESFKRHK